MGEINVNARPIQPEVPKLLDNEQLNIYVPNATNEYPGVASFNADHFEVSREGAVKIGKSVMDDLTYVRKSMDAKNNDVLDVDADGDYRNTALLTNAGLIIPAINEVHSRSSVNENKIGEGFILVPDNGAADETGLIRLANANRRKLNSFIEDTDDKHAEVDETLGQINDHLNEHSSTLSNHNGRILDNALGIASLQRDLSAQTDLIGDAELETVNKTLKGAINENYDLSKSNEQSLRYTDVRLTSLYAQVQGIGKTHVLQTFSDFYDFILGYKPITIMEDRYGNDGKPESYSIYPEDLTIGDNLLIVETSVADFWFEKTSDYTKKDSYEYNGTNYDLTVWSSIGEMVGVMHVLETDYNVIQNHAISAANAAAEARTHRDAAYASEVKASEYKDEVKRLANSIYLLQVAPPLSVLNTAVILTKPTLSQL